MHALGLDACLFGLWESPRGRFVVLVSICLLGLRGPSRVAGAELLGLKPVTAGECLPDLRDYTFMWWAHGWRGAKVRCYQTGRYGLAMDTAAMRLLRFGTFDQTPGYAAAASLPNDVVLGLPDAFLEITVQVGAKTYRCASGAYPRLIESGRFVQRSDVEGLAFKDDQGGALAAEGRFELVAWPDRLAAHVDIKPHAALSQARASLRFRAGAATVTRESPPGDWPTGQIQTIDAVLFGPPREAEPGEVAVTAWDLTTKAAVPVRYDRVGGWFRVDVPSLLPERTDIPQMDRLRVRAANPSASPRAVRLCFAKEDAVPGITGLVPMLRDAEGFPVGIPVQISKNWHRKAERRLRYEGPWLHAFSMLSSTEACSAVGRCAVAPAAIPLFPERVSNGNHPSRFHDGSLRDRCRLRLSSVGGGTRSHSLCGDRAPAGGLAARPDLLRLLGFAPQQHRPAECRRFADQNRRVVLPFHPHVGLRERRGGGGQGRAKHHGLCAGGRGRDSHGQPGQAVLSVAGYHGRAGVKDFASRAAFVIAAGTCASFGGVAAGSPNPTAARSLGAVVGTARVVNVPGCPTHPDWLVGTIAYLLKYGQAPALDGHRRPVMYFKSKVHDLCPYREDDHNLCLEDQGCRGKQTRGDCPARRWNSPGAATPGVNWCVLARSPCHGCTEPTFPDGMSPFYKEDDEGDD